MALAVWRLRADDQMGIADDQVHAQLANLGLRGARPLGSGDAFHEVVDGAHDVDLMDRRVRAGLELRLGAGDAVGESHGVGHLVGNGGVFKEHVGEQQSGGLVAGTRPEGELIDLAITRLGDHEATEAVAGWGFGISASGPEWPARSMRREQEQRIWEARTPLQGGIQGESLISVDETDGRTL